MEQETKQTRSPEEEAQKEDVLLYGGGPGLGVGDVDERWPNRPHNHSVTLFFSVLFRNLFNPLTDIKAQPASRGQPRGRHDVGRISSRLSPHEQRRNVIMRFMSHWRSEVGDDFYPALRLILPEKDRDRNAYGLKENTIGKLLVKLMKIDKNSEDGYSLLHWKLPAAASMAGDFAGRCFEVLAKRPLRTDVGKLRIGQVNILLDKLAAASNETEQLLIFETFYRQMNPEELTWLIRIILKQMRIGASERTILNMWHPDGEALFNVSSSLRRVCWELFDPQVRLEQDEAGVALMQCFQPQLAQFQMPASFQRMVEKLGTTENDKEFWIEEKLDGERMQMHMLEDDAVPGGKRFSFWSRKAKDYTDLYGFSFGDRKSALTQHLASAFSEGVHSLILDGEMITWDPKLDKMVAFGTLKGAAIATQNNPHDAMAPRPLFRVFDILFLNGQPLARYTLRDRHRALGKAVIGIPRRLEIHPHETATDAEAIEPMLRQIVADSSEGLVLKNPRSIYRLNSRNYDWIKVKPEYMTEFGEALDCIIIGGYFGSGHRGGMLSSYLCGLRVGRNDIDSGANPEKCLSFFKVGGGFKAEDYAEIRHLTEDKWVEWDNVNPPSDYIQLAGDETSRIEKPDVWIRPKDSIVLSVKAASVSPSDSFATGETLRFPRFRRLRLDRAWDTSLDTDQFRLLRDHADEEARDKKEMQIENRRQRRPRKKSKLDLIVAGQGRRHNRQDAMPSTAFMPGAAAKNILSGVDFCVLSEATRPLKKTKAQLETLVKEHGGRVCQQPRPGSGMILLADKRVIKVASLIEAGNVDIVKPQWLFDCLSQIGGGFLLPFEAHHLLHATEDAERRARDQTDGFGDSFARDVGVDELRGILEGMQLCAHDANPLFSRNTFLDQLEEHGHDLGQVKCFIFRRCAVYFAATGKVQRTTLLRLGSWMSYGGGAVVNNLEDAALTHVVIVGQGDTSGESGELTASIRRLVSSKPKQPRIVGAAWVDASWEEGTRLDEERYALG